MRRFKKIFTPLLSLLICVSVFVSAPLSSSALLSGMPEDLFEATSEDSYSLNMLSFAYDDWDVRDAPSGSNRMPFPYAQYLTNSTLNPFFGTVDGYNYRYLDGNYVRLSGTASVASWFFLFRSSGSNVLILGDSDSDFYLNCFTNIYSGRARVVVQGNNYAGEFKQVVMYLDDGFVSAALDDFMIITNVALAFSAGDTFDFAFRCSLSDISDNEYKPFYKMHSSLFSANYNSWNGVVMNDGEYYGFINGFGNIGTVVPAVYGYEYRVSCKIGFNTDYNDILPDFMLLGVVPSSDLLNIDDFSVTYSYEDNLEYPISPNEAGSYVAWADVSFSFKTMSLDIPDQIGLEFQTIFKNTYSVAKFIIADFKIQTVNLVPTLVENSVTGILGVLNGTFIPGGGSEQIEDLNDRNQSLTDSANNQQSGFLSQEELEQQYRENLLQYKDTAAFGEVSSQIRSFVLQYYDGFVWWRGAMDEILSFGPVIGLVSISVFVSCFFLLVKLSPTIGWLGRRERSKAEANERDRAREESRQREAAARERDSWRNRYRGPQD